MCLKLRRYILSLLLFSHAVFSLQYILSNLSCSNTLNTVVNDISFECDEYCSLGKKGNFSALISYEDLESVKLIIQLDFSAIYNTSSSYSSTYLSSNTEIKNLNESLTFSQYHDICYNNSCNGNGQFELNFQYTIPTFGDLNDFIIGTDIQIFLLSFDDYHLDEVIGACQALFSSGTEGFQNSATWSSTIHITSNIISSSYFFYGTIAGASLGIIVLFSKCQKKDERDDIINFLNRKNTYFLERRGDWAVVMIKLQRDEFDIDYTDSNCSLYDYQLSQQSSIVY